MEIIYQQLVVENSSVIHTHSHISLIYIDLLQTSPNPLILTLILTQYEPEL